MTDSVCDGATGTCSCPAAMYLDGMTCRNRKLEFLSVHSCGSYGVTMHLNTVELRTMMACLP